MYMFYIFFNDFCNVFLYKYVDALSIGLLVHKQKKLYALQICLNLKKKSLFSTFSSLGQSVVTECSAE